MKAFAKRVEIKDTLDKLKKPGRGAATLQAVAQQELALN